MPTAPEPLTAVHRSARRGMMPPLHRRNEDERFRVVEGEVRFFVGDEVVSAHSGDEVFAPRDVARTFVVDSERARWVVLTRVESVDRFTDFTRAVCPPADEWTSELELRSIRAMASANGIELLGPPGAVPGGGRR